MWVWDYLKVIPEASSTANAASCPGAKTKKSTQVKLGGLSKFFRRLAALDRGR